MTFTFTDEEAKIIRDALDTLHDRLGNPYDRRQVIDLTERIEYQYPEFNPLHRQFKGV